MNFLEYQVRLDSLAVGLVDESQLAASVPATLDHAEQRIYRELDLLAAEVTDAAGTLTPNVRTYKIDANVPFTVMMKASVFSGDPNRPTRSQLEPVSRDLLDGVYGSSGDTGLPAWFAMLDASTIAVGPWPDAGYGIEIVGKVRPASLYTLGATGQSFLSQFLPDLLMAASLAFLEAAPTSGKRPEQPVWEAKYQSLLASAAVEEARRQFTGPGWSSLSRPAGASPTR